MSKWLAPVTIVTAFALGALSPQAQTTGQKVGFVNVDALFAAHPGDKEIKALQTKYKKEMGDLSNKIKALNAKGAKITASEKDQRAQMMTTYNTKAKSYDQQIKAKGTPIEKSIDTALAKYAKENGYSIIMNSTVAQQTGLVVYADSSSNLTEAVKKIVK